MSKRRDYMNKANTFIIVFIFVLFFNRLFNIIEIDPKISVPLNFGLTGIINLFLGQSYLERNKKITAYMLFAVGLFLIFSVVYRLFIDIVG